eukprot:TRINITY_DN12443_c0_g1_i3.p1 TRINITY_DN12443_c0_g1~~TRINITY_DN12443_c0_g1_i3.p1  ORF type:complete len:1077 (-),score=234.61 TRINITY_DN12443_c0_g1_i3:257-3487(-)
MSSKEIVNPITKAFVSALKKPKNEKVVRASFDLINDKKDGKVTKGEWTTYMVDTFEVVVEGLLKEPKKNNVTVALRSVLASFTESIDYKELTETLFMMTDVEKKGYLEFSEFKTFVLHWSTRKDEFLISALTLKQMQSDVTKVSPETVTTFVLDERQQVQWDLLEKLVKEGLLNKTQYDLQKKKLGLSVETSSLSVKTGTFSIPTLQLKTTSDPTRNLPLSLSSRTLSQPVIEPENDGGSAATKGRNKRLRAMEARPRIVQCTPTHGIIRAYLIGARHLNNTHKYGQPNSYALFSYTWPKSKANDNEVMQSSVQRNTLEPVWDQHFSFYIDSPTDAHTLTVNIWDAQMFGLLINLGYLSFSVKEIVEGKFNHTQWYCLKDMGKKNNGQIHISLVWEELTKTQETIKFNIDPTAITPNGDTESNPLGVAIEVADASSSSPQFLPRKSRNRSNSHVDGQALTKRSEKSKQDNHGKLNRSSISFQPIKPHEEEFSTFYSTKKRMSGTFVDRKKDRRHSAILTFKDHGSSELVVVGGGVGSSSGGGGGCGTGGGTGSGTGSGFTLLLSSSRAGKDTESEFEPEGMKGLKIKGGSMTVKSRAKKYSPSRHLLGEMPEIEAPKNQSTDQLTRLKKSLDEERRVNKSLMEKVAALQEQTEISQKHVQICEAHSINENVLEREEAVTDQFEKLKQENANLISQLKALEEKTATSIEKQKADMNTRCKFSQSQIEQLKRDLEKEKSQCFTLVAKLEKLGAENLVLKNSIEKLRKIQQESAQKGNLIKITEITEEQLPNYLTYSPSNLLGEGAYAAVYKALYVQESIFVAVKVINLLNAMEEMESVYREMDIQRSLSHVNTLSLFALFQLNKDRFLLVMPLMEGGNLLDFVNNFDEDGDYGLPTREARNVIKQMLLGIKHMHDNFIAHCDIKPENVLLDANFQTIKLCDFGQSKKFSQEKPELSGYCGTAYYQALEIWQRANYTKAIDLWALGVVVYVTIAKSQPWDYYFGDLLDNPDFMPTDEELREAIVNTVNERAFPFEEPDFPDLGITGDDLKDLILKLIVVDPEKRLTARQALNHPWLVSF